MIYGSMSRSASLTVAMADCRDQLSRVCSLPLCSIAKAKWLKLDKTQVSFI
jgi:hypothetical protein